jgi:hypothetical protein
MSTQLVLTPQQFSQGKIGTTFLRIWPTAQKSDYLHE